MGKLAARLKSIKGSIRVLRDPATEQYISLENEHRPPQLAELHLATLRPDTAEGRAQLERLASRRGVVAELVRIDAL